ncbi:hypothetical protein BCR37DRAFT_382420 [Protomyces lactucae-debilis]|uniref:Uncharacterized protein n=1 Tax=Protomyces lactucae-debilis TaxID=2754530 RepID=A0A1Y2F2S2_PROLT|nr:uncharacterized protein BCR37DRAFT_382420 [Protomyces lactucae-debilis]ORY78162.1 hypothetical protein BCR37DRAFT_382420 [Protomyces lactucae-debilis]
MQVKAIESDISRLTVLSSTLFSQLEDALERQHMSRPVTAAVVGETPERQERGMSRAQMERLWAVPMLVRSPVEERRVREERALLVDRQAQAEDAAAAVLQEDAGEDLSSEDEDDVRTTKRKMLPEGSPSKRTQFLTQEQAQVAGTVMGKEDQQQQQQDKMTEVEADAHLSSDAAVAVEEVRFTALDMDRLRQQAHASIERLQRRRRYLKHVQGGYAAYLERLARTEGELTRVAGRWEEDERARLEGEARRLRGKQAQTSRREEGGAVSHEEEEDQVMGELEEEEAAGVRVRRAVERCLEVCSWVGMGAAAGGLLVSRYAV